MRRAAIGGACVMLAACGPKAADQATPASVVATPPAETLADQAMLTRAAAIRSALIPQLLAKTCRSAGGSGLCRNLAIPCAVQQAVESSDQANGVADRLVFMTRFETSATAAGPWRAGGEYIRVELTADGSWNSVGAADGNGGSCDDAGLQPIRQIRFSP